MERVRHGEVVEALEAPFGESGEDLVLDALGVVQKSLELLWIARGQFSGRPSAVYFASAGTAMLILISSTSSTFGDETGDKFFTRVGSIVVAAGILTLGLPLAAHLFRPRRATN